MKTNEVELELFVHRETDAAYQVSDDSMIKNAVWLPKSIVDPADDVQVGKSGHFMVPEWLANEKGLI